MKVKIIDKTMLDKDIEYMKEMQRKLEEDEKRQRKEQDNKDVALVEQLEKEDALRKRIIKKIKIKYPKKTYKRLKKGKK